MAPTIKIWKIGDSDWIAAATREDAIRLLGEMIGEGKPFPTHFCTSEY